jgi:DNA-binding NarL/FixJ family response regulator
MMLENLLPRVSVNLIRMDNISCAADLDIHLRDYFPDVTISTAHSVSDVVDFAVNLNDESSPIIIVYVTPWSQNESQVRLKPPPAPSLTERFTQRQLQLIDLMMRGNSNKAIADKLNLSYGTVKNYVFDIMRIMSVGSRLQLVAKMRTDALAWDRAPVGRAKCPPEAGSK